MIVTVTLKGALPSTRTVILPYHGQSHFTSLKYFENNYELIIFFNTTLEGGQSHRYFRAKLSQAGQVAFLIVLGKVAWRLVNII